MTDQQQTGDKKHLAQSAIQVKNSHSGKAGQYYF